jgi:hypothetical protein
MNDRTGPRRRLSIFATLAAEGWDSNCVRYARPL